MVFRLYKRENFELLNKLTTSNRGNISGARYLFKDDFSIPISAPLPSLSNASYQGVWATVDVENLMSVSGGVLNVPAQVTAVWGEEYRRAQPNTTQQYWTRPTGKALVAVTNFRHSTRNSQLPVGWWNSATLNATSNPQGAIATVSNVILSNVNGTGVSDSQSYNISTDYSAVAVWDSTGFHTFVKISGVWHRKWFTPSSVTQAYCGMSNLSAAGSLKYFRIYAVDETLFAPALSINNPSVGNLSDMPDGDFLLYLDNITRPSAGNIFVRTRLKDTSNYWRIPRVASDGGFSGDEVVAGVVTGRITSTGVVSTDDIITINRAQTIQAWRNTIALGSAYTSAYNFLREIGLELNSLGTGGAIGNLYAWKTRLLDETGLGAELVVNGSFATDTVWTKGTGWTIATGVATKAAGVQSNLEQANILTIGKYYELTFTISGYIAGTLSPFLGSSAVLAPIFANGTYTVKSVCAGTTNLGFSASSTFVGSIDNVSCKEITFTTDNLATVLDGLTA